MKNLFLLFACFIFSAKLFATAQAPDYLIIDKDTVCINSNPLEQYFKEHPIPKPANGIVSGSSANWRGYIAFFKFQGDKLVVENIYREVYNNNEKGEHISKLISIYKEAFGDVENFPCDFYNGLLICPYGKLLQYVHMGYSSIYEYYKLFEIKSGINIKSKDFNAEEFQQFKKDYYSYYKTTEEYRVKAKELKEMSMSMNADLDKMFSEDNGRKKKKENKYLKQKEAEFKADKELDSFMFLFDDDYIKTIDIPKKE